MNDQRLRNLVIILLIANLGFGAWATWIDKPVQRPAARDISHLPRLLLVSEAQAGARPSSAPAAPVAAVARCVSVGAFGDLDAAARAAALLQSRGFTPRQRAEPGKYVMQYGVYVRASTEGQETKLLDQLHKGGLADAQP